MVLWHDTLMATAPDTRTEDRLGEVVEASTTGFVAQCYELYEAPPLGSLVRSGAGDPIYGIVHDVATLSMDPARHPIPRGRDEGGEDSVHRSNPQLARLLHTEFHATIVGHGSGDHLRRFLPPAPPRIYSRVHLCVGEELRVFSDSLEFLPLLLTSTIGATDDVIASFLRQAGAARPDPEGYLVDAGRELAVLLVGQLPRLNGVLRRLSP